MTTPTPTLLGHVVSVTGGTVAVHLARSIASGQAIIDGSLYRVGQVGAFVRIPQGYLDLFGTISAVGANAVPDNLVETEFDSGRWIRAELVGESLGGTFERGISQYPNVNDEVHMVTERDLWRIYGATGKGYVDVGSLSSAEKVRVRVSIERLVTRHAAILGSTGAGKSTTVASLLRSLVRSSGEQNSTYPSARILLLDIHGEYGTALGELARVFKLAAENKKGEHALAIPYWALEASSLLGFLFGSLTDAQSLAVLDKVLEYKTKSLASGAYQGLSEQSLTVDSPVPFSLKKLWYDLIEPEVRTYSDTARTQPALIERGDAETLTPPKYQPPTSTNSPPFINPGALGLRRQLMTLRSRLLDRRYDFLLHPGVWEPNIDGKSGSDLDALLQNWLGHEKPITILDLSGVPSEALTRLVGSILRVIYEAMFWSRDLPEGAVRRPILMVMEEAHRYLSPESAGGAKEIVQRIVKEGRKYGMGAMIVSQRPSEVDETILSQCGTYFALRLSNPSDRSKVQGTLPDSMAGLMDMLPVLRTGEVVVVGEAAQLPVRCRISLPEEKARPNSMDPEVVESWSAERKKEDYAKVVATWRAQGNTGEFKPEKPKT